MKKIAIASLICLASAAMATEVSVTASRGYALDGARNSAGVSIGNTYGAIGVAVGAERTSVGGNDQNRYSLTGRYDLVKLGPVTISPTVGLVALDNQTGADGYAVTVGVGASVPLTKSIAATVDVSRQYGQNRVQAFDGNRVTVGVRYSF